MPGQYTVVVKVDVPPRGDTPQPYVEFTPAECVVTQSWGLQPARALIDWVSAQQQEAIIPNASLTIEVAGGIQNGGHTFWGICRSVVPVLGSDGISMMQEFVDSREFLMWDVAYCAFNIRVDRIVNGVFTKFYKHILPANFNTFTETYTSAPYTAAQILDFLFAAPTTETPWTRVYHAFHNQPVFGLDCTNGRKLGAVVQEISERLGLSFTLQGGRYRLVWGLKGVGTLPDFPATADMKRGPGLALSGNPTRVRLLGDRNVYQILDIWLVPDWLDGWQQFFDFNAFVRDIFLNERTEAQFGSIAAGTAYSSIDPETENNAGYLLARARAQRITVAEYANLRDARDGSGSQFRDYRKFQNRSRLQMPAALYLGNVLFRAFRFPPGFTIRNGYGQHLGLTSLELLERSVVQVTHDPVTGEMFYETLIPSQPNGYAIVQGYQVASDAFRTLVPEHFDLNQWKDQQELWQAAPFHMDNSGEGDQFIVFDDPVIKSGDLIDTVLIGGVTQPYCALKSGAAPSTPAVRAALTFAAEKFSWIAGTGTKDDVENVAGLNGELVGYSGFVPVELTYADGFTASQKAAQLAAVLLNRQFYYAYGGWIDYQCRGTQLTTVMDRVTVTVNRNGFSEEIDFTNERARNVTVSGGTAYLQLEPDRDFNRRAQLVPLLAGQAELRQEANQLRVEAGFLLKNPRISRTIVETFHLLMGLDSPPDVTQINGGTGTLAVGTPLVRPSTANVPVQPDGSAIGSPAIVGVTVVHDEPATGPVRFTRSGNGGIVFARVKGPVNTGDEVGATDATDYLTKDADTGFGVLIDEGWATTDVKLVRVCVGTAAPAATGGTLRGIWVSGENYDKYDMVTYLSSRPVGTSARQALWVFAWGGGASGGVDSPRKNAEDGHAYVALVAGYWYLVSYTQVTTDASPTPDTDAYQDLIDGGD